MHRATATARTEGSELRVEERHGSIITTIMYACQSIFVYKIDLYIFITGYQ
jgi:hypothetical protein